MSYRPLISMMLSQTLKGVFFLQDINSDIGIRISAAKAKEIIQEKKLKKVKVWRSSKESDCFYSYK